LCFSFSGLFLVGLQNPLVICFQQWRSRTALPEASAAAADQMTLGGATETARAGDE
jgi:hypothetical protein